MIMRAICFDKIGGNNYLLYTIPFNDRPIFNVPGISEVPSVARNLDGVIAKSNMHLLGDRAEQGEGRNDEAFRPEAVFLFFPE